MTAGTLRFKTHTSTRKGILKNILLIPLLFLILSLTFFQTNTTNTTTKENLNNPTPNNHLQINPQQATNPPELQWQKTYGGTGYDEADSIQQTNDGGYIIAGFTNSSGNGGHDVYVLKLDGNGDLQWQKTYGGRGYDGAYSVQQTKDGGYIVAGLTFSFGHGGADVYVLKLDGSGNLQWQKTYGGPGEDVAYSVQQTNDGGYIVAGYTNSSGNWGVYVLKLNGNGDLQWQKTYRGPGKSGAYSVQQTNDGGYIVAGYTWSFAFSNWDVYVLKLDGNGDLQWQKTYGGPGEDVAYSVQQTNDGGYIVAGYILSFSIPSGNWDVYVLKLDGSGNLQWQKTYGGGDSDRAWSVQQTNDGGYIVAGYTFSFSFGLGHGDVYVLKLNGNGDLQWQKTYGGRGYDGAYSVQQTKDGGYIVAGLTFSFGNGGDVYVLKLASQTTPTVASSTTTSITTSLTTPTTSQTTPTVASSTTSSSQITTGGGVDLLPLVLIVVSILIIMVMVIVFLRRRK